MTTMTSNQTVLPPAASVLADAKVCLSILESARTDRERDYQIQVLPILLKQGLWCLKAHVAFCVEPTKRKGIGGRGKTVSTVDTVSPEGFEGWLSTAAPWLKRPNAYRYMTAVRGLGLDDSATEEDIDAALAARGLPNASIKALCDAAAEAFAQPKGPEPKRLEQAEFDFLRDSLAAFRVEAETLCALGPRLDAYPDFKRAATARAYVILHELTGTHWRPSDEPDPLASVDPDSITI
jgi:hypothetical protein